MKFKGTADDLRQAIAGAGIKVNVEEKENLVIFRTDKRGICRWTPSTGTLTFQGQEGEREKLEAAVSKYVNRRAERQAKAVAAPLMAAAKRGSKKKKIFVVHGHDEVARDQLELVLHELGLKPFVLARSSGEGLTIIEALERHIRPDSPEAASFGIVLLTPDDMGHARKAGGIGSKARARQNVILELGMLIAALGRKKVAVLKTGTLELPSDIDGVLYLEFRSHVREVVPRLYERLQGAGFEISSAQVAKAASL